MMNGLADDLPVQTDTVPLRVDESGVVRVGESRVALADLLDEYESGVTPEEMVRAHEGLELADVHAVIAYYLRHRHEIGEFLNRRRDDAQNHPVHIAPSNRNGADVKP
jgi:uncharacterized protein (DUF433 family)